MIWQSRRQVCAKLCLFPPPEEEWFRRSVPSSQPTATATLDTPPTKCVAGFTHGNVTVGLIMTVWRWVFSHGGVRMVLSMAVWGWVSFGSMKGGFPIVVWGWVYPWQCEGGLTHGQEPGADRCFLWHHLPRWREVVAGVPGAGSRR